MPNGIERLYSKGKLSLKNEASGIAVGGMVMVSKSFLLIIMSFVINLFASPAALFAEELYVRPSAGEYGNESGISFLDAFDGWSGIVWGSGVGKVGPGDTVYVCGDFSNEYVNIAESGKPDNRIIIRGDYMGNIATIDAQAKSKAMRLDGADYVTIMNLKLTGAAYEGLGSVAPCKNLIVDNVTCYKNKGTGISVSGNGLILRNLTVYSNLSCGIRITNANSAYVFKCNVFNNGTEGNNDDGLFVGNASEAFIIEECVVSGQKGQSSYDVSCSVDRNEKASGTFRNCKAFDGPTYGYHSALTLKGRIVYEGCVASNHYINYQAGLYEGSEAIFSNCTGIKSRDSGWAIQGQGKRYVSIDNCFENADNAYWVLKIGDDDGLCLNDKDNHWYGGTRSFAKINGANKTWEKWKSISSGNITVTGSFYNPKYSDNVLIPPTNLKKID